MATAIWKCRDWRVRGNSVDVIEGTSVATAIGKSLVWVGVWLTLVGWPGMLAQATQDPVEAQLSSGQAEVQEEEKEPPVHVDEVAEDQKISDRLQKAFESSGWFTEVDVKAENGIVTLNGSVDTDEHRQWATDVVRRTEDVLAVIDKLSVEHEVDVTTNAVNVWKSLSVLWHDFLGRSPLLLLSLVVLVVTALLARATNGLVHWVMDNRKFRVGLKDLFAQLSSIGIWILGLLTASVVAFPGMTPSKAITVLGLGSIAIGFAFKDIFENFFAGVLILWQYPFDRGDFIKCDDVCGRVERITIRSTMIRQLDGELAVVPNGTLFKNKVEVLTNHPQRRVRIICGVAYGEDVNHSRSIIQAAVEGCETVQGKRTIEVFAQEFADSSINFEVAWWTGAKPVDIRRSRDEVIAAIKHALDDAGIEIPFPYRTLTFKQPLAIQSQAESPSSAVRQDG